MIGKIRESLLVNSKLKELNDYPYVGIPELRAEFARWYKRWYGVDLDPANEILPLIGSKEGVMHISLAFLNERRGTHTQSGLSDLRLSVEVRRRPHPALRPERRERLAARFRSTGENGPVRCETDVVQLPQHAYGSQRFAGAVRKNWSPSAAGTTS